MEMIKRKVRLFFVTYGRLLAFIIGIICIVIFVIQSLNSMVIKQNDDKYSNDLYQSNKVQQEQKKRDRQYIKQFIEYCIEGRIQEAYEMLSNECKEEKYNTIEEFEKNYINIVFGIKICDYKIIKKNNDYIIKLTQDMIVTGRTDSIIEQKYQIIGVLERKIYISN